MNRISSIILELFFITLLRCCNNWPFVEFKESKNCQKTLKIQLCLRSVILMDYELFRLLFYGLHVALRGAGNVDRVFLMIGWFWKIECGIEVNLSNV